MKSNQRYLIYAFFMTVAALCLWHVIRAPLSVIPWRAFTERDFGNDAGDWIWDLWYYKNAVSNGWRLSFTHLVRYPIGWCPTAFFGGILLPIAAVPLQTVLPLLGAYNVLITLCMLFNGVSMFLFLYELPVNAYLAVSGGVLLMLNPLTLDHISWGGATFYLPGLPVLGLLFWRRFIQRPSLKSMAAASFLFMIGIINSFYELFFYGILAGYLVLLNPWLKSTHKGSSVTIKSWLRSGIRASVIPAFVIILAMPFLSVINRQLQDSEKLVQFPQKANPPTTGSWLRFPDGFHPRSQPQIDYKELHERDARFTLPLYSHDFLFPFFDLFGRAAGYYQFLYLIAFAALLLKPRESAAWLGLGALFHVLANGPILHVGGHPLLMSQEMPMPTPFSILAYLAPVFWRMRLPLRFEIVVTIAFITVAARSLQAIGRKLARGRSWIFAAGALLLIVPSYSTVWDKTIPLPIKRLTSMNFFERLAKLPARAIIECPQNDPTCWSFQFYYQTIHRKPRGLGYCSTCRTVNSEQLLRNPLLHALDDVSRNLPVSIPVAREDVEELVRNDLDALVVYADSLPNPRDNFSAIEQLLSSLHCPEIDHDKSIYLFDLTGNYRELTNADGRSGVRAGTE